MPYSENSIEIMKNENEKVSNSISNYMLNDVKVKTQNLYPNDPSIKYQGWIIIGLFILLIVYCSGIKSIKNSALSRTA